MCVCQRSYVCVWVHILLVNEQLRVSGMLSRGGLMVVSGGTRLHDVENKRRGGRKRGERDSDRKEGFSYYPFVSLCLPVCESRYHVR